MFQGIVPRGRLPETLTSHLGPFTSLCRLPFDLTQLLALFVISTRPVDIGHPRAHRAQIRGELPAVVDAVIVGEADVPHRRPVEIAEEANRRRQRTRHLLELSWLV